MYLMVTGVLWQCRSSFSWHFCHLRPQCADSSRYGVILWRARNWKLEAGRTVLPVSSVQHLASRVRLPTVLSTKKYYHGVHRYKPVLSNRLATKAANLLADIEVPNAAVAMDA